MLPLLAVAQAVGILAADRLGLSAQVALLLGIESLLAGLLLASGRRARVACASLVCFAAGAAGLASRLEEARRHRPAAAMDVDIEALVSATTASASHVSVDLREVAPVRALGPPLPSRVRISEERGSPAAAWLLGRSAGERVRVRARLRSPHGARNPGQTDDARRLARRGIGARGSLVDATLVARVSERDAAGAAVRRRLGAPRRRLLADLTRAGPRTGLLRALALGDRSGLAAEQLAAVRRLGLAHLLAVSGLHLAMTAALAFSFARRVQGLWAAATPSADLRLRALLFAAGAATFYAALSGAGVPVRRALVFVWAVVAGVAWARRIPASHVLALAALGVLAWDPGCLFELGPQLSFAATAALLVARREPRAEHAEPWRSAPRGWLRPLEAGAPSRWLRDRLDPTCIALAVTAPILALHGLASGAAGLLANLVGIPWTALVLLPAALVATAAACLTGLAPADAVVDAAAWIAATSLEAAVALADWLPPLAQRAPPAGWAIGLAGLFAVACLASRRTLSRLSWSVCVLVWLGLAPASELHPLPPRWVVLDVGQGDASLVQGREASVLIDGGRASPSGLDLGRSVVLPALAALGIRHLDLVVASHGDADHAGGLAAVLGSVGVGELWLPAGAADDDRLAALCAHAAARGVPVREIGRGAPTRRFGDLEVEVLWPAADAAAGTGNEASLALRIDLEGHRLLLVGDLGFRSEAHLLAESDELAADVLKVGHHGSAASSSPAFLAAVAPALAVVSASCGGRARLPDAGALARLRAAGAAVWWTGRDGAVIVRLDREVPAPVATSLAPARSCGP